MRIPRCTVASIPSPKDRVGGPSSMAPAPPSRRKDRRWRAWAPAACPMKSHATTTGTNAWPVTLRNGIGGFFHGPRPAFKCRQGVEGFRGRLVHSESKFFPQPLYVAAPPKVRSSGPFAEAWSAGGSGRAPDSQFDLTRGRKDVMKDWTEHSRAIFGAGLAAWCIGVTLLGGCDTTGGNDASGDLAAIDTRDDVPGGGCNTPGDCRRAECAGRLCGVGCTCLPSGPGETACIDGDDNDRDGLTDCVDPDCAGQSCGVGCTCFAGARNESLCGDRTDNDGDMLVDCMDPDCNGVMCGPACTCVGTAGFETVCSDRMDNDRDSRIDCDDPD